LWSNKGASKDSPSLASTSKIHACSLYPDINALSAPIEQQQQQHRRTMKYFQLLSFAGCALHAANGFAPAPLATRGVSPTLIGAKSPSVFNIENDDNENVHLRTTFTGNKLNSSSKIVPKRNNKMIIAASSAAMMAIAAFGLPIASNAMMTISDISSIAGGASASAASWLDSLTDSGFYQAFSLVFLSEIGDKTFFVAALLAAKLSRFISFVGSLGALAVMSVISVVIGQVFHAVPAGIANGVPLDDVAAVIAFTYFGVKVLGEALESDGKSAMDEEFEEAEEETEKFTKGSNTGYALSPLNGYTFFVQCLSLNNNSPFITLNQSANCQYFCSCICCRVWRSFLPCHHCIVSCTESSFCLCRCHCCSRNCYWNCGARWGIHLQICF
jgi:putative Ca2+/H+ antiporter (TMEM165/GDT1 family)